MNSRKENTVEYKINEIFYSIQAEGINAGRPAVFVRFSGCNLKCPFCDTANHDEGKLYTKEQLENEVTSLDPTEESIIVLTGGEPTMQLKERLFKGRYICIETNGIIPAPRWVKHVTISPKTHLTVSQLENAKEIKCVFGSLSDAEMQHIQNVAEMNRIRLFIQPMADANGNFDPNPAIEFAKRNPIWTVSLQWHKLFNIR